MNEKTSKLNPNGKAIYETLAARPGEILALAEIAHIAGIEAKTGFLTAAKKIAKDNGATLQKVIGGVKVKIQTATEYPNGYTANSEKEATLDGYRLVEGEQPKEIDAEKLEKAE